MISLHDVPSQNQFLVEHMESLGPAVVLDDVEPDNPGYIPVLFLKTRRSFEFQAHTPVVDLRR